MDPTSLPDLGQPLILGISASALATGLVEAEKKLGLPVTWTGPASIINCLVLLLLVGAYQGGLTWQAAAGYALYAILTGLAGNGIYSQAKMLERATG